MTEPEAFRKWLDTCPFHMEHIYEERGKRTTKTRVLFTYASGDSPWLDPEYLKVGGTIQGRVGKITTYHFQRYHGCAGNANLTNVESPITFILLTSV